MMVRTITALALAWCLLAGTASAQVTPPPPPPTPVPNATPTVSPAPGEVPATESPSASPSPTSSPLLSPSPTGSPSPAPLIATPASVQSNVGKPVSLTVAGASGAISATLDQKLASVTVQDTTITLGPIRNGTATLHVVDAAGATVDVPLRIAPNAGTIAPAITVKITGTSAQPAFVAQQAQLALTRATLAQPGAVLNLPAIAAPPSPLPVGQSFSMTVPVTINGGTQYLDVSADTQITLQNVAAQPFAPSILYYSDDPERIVSDGVLFRGTISAGQPVRVYDYHENYSQVNRHLVVVFSAPANSGASVQTIESFAGPNIDVMGVGHAVTRNFLVNKPLDQGMIIDLNTGAPYIDRDVAMTYRQGVANNTDINVLSGGPVTYTILAVSPGVNPLALLDGPVLPGDGKHRTGVYSLANYGTQSVAYAAGGPEAKISLGDREPTVPKIRPDSNGQDYGDYGVLFNLSFALSNPSKDPQTIYIYEAPRGGPVRASYLIDGTQLTELGCATSPRTATSPPNRYLIAQFRVGANASETHTVQTMTDGGSNFPIEIGATTTAPQLATPPISAPDGCFPKPPPAASPAPAGF